MINGSTLKSAIISGANNISNQKRLVDELNVFPVPDGDTGTNMSMTIQNGARELKNVSDSATVGEVSKVTADALLRGARGNSGVILSLLFRGFSKGLKGKEEADGKDLAEALAIGVEGAYKAVMQPTEGTILTVARVASEKAAEAVKKGTTDAVEIWDVIVKAADDALATTPDLLPVLKKAGVVDSGGKGLCIIFTGMQQVFHGEPPIEYSEKKAPVVATPEVSIASDQAGRNAAGEFQTEITYTYCTEFIVNRENKRDPLSLRAFLESIGDCVVVVDVEEIIKIHVHTNHPGLAFEEGLKFGSLTRMKIENMREQHSHQVQEVQQQKENNTYVPVDPDIEFGFVSIAAGEGLKNLFFDLGCAKVVSGGQTMNPSTDDILSAVQAVPAKIVFVLPNNKNIIMAAEQAIPLADRRIVVIPTTTIPQGVSAMLAFDAGNSELDNQMAMTEAAKKVESGSITYAARDSDFEGKKIKKGEIMALANGKISFLESDLTKAVLRLSKTLTKKGTEFITLFYGADVTADEANATFEALRAKTGKDIELTLVDGGQPVYYYLLSVE